MTSSRLGLLRTVLLIKVVVTLVAWGLPRKWTFFSGWPIIRHKLGARMAVACWGDGLLPRDQVPIVLASTFCGSPSL